MVSELKPDVLQMLEMGEACGLTYLDEAYDNYMRHYDLFFYIPEFNEQQFEFFSKLREYGLVKESQLKGDKVLYELINISITKAIELVKSQTLGSGILPNK